MATHRRRLTALERRGYLWPYDSWANRVGVHAFVRDIPMRPTHPTWPVLRTIEGGLAQFNDRPVLLVWGARDFCFNDHFLARWRQVLPAAAVTRFADAGHYVLEDARAEAVARISSFLAAG
jgi:haloalkane dehalogenase